MDLSGVNKKFAAIGLEAVVEEDASQFGRQQQQQQQQHMESRTRLDTPSPAHSSSSSEVEFWIGDAGTPSSSRPSPVSSVDSSPIRSFAALDGERHLKALTQRTSFLCISDTHGGNFDVPTRPVDVLLVCGDIVAKPNKTLVEQVELTVGKLDKVNAGLKLIIAGNHDEPLDASLDGRREDAEEQRKAMLKMFQEKDIIYLEEGRHEWTLANGARLKLYASPETPSRKWSYKAFAYERRDGHCFDIDEDIDVVRTHGPPLNIRYPHPDKDEFRGDESLRHHVSRARPLAHIFGHNHGGYGMTLVDWKPAVGGVETESGAWKPKGNARMEPERDEQEAGREDVLTVKDLGENGGLLSEGKGYLGSAHGAMDKHSVEKGKNTLFVNACYSAWDNGPEQVALMIELDLPKASSKAGDKTGAPRCQKGTRGYCAAHGRRAVWRPSTSRARPSMSGSRATSSRGYVAPADGLTANREHARPLPSRTNSRYGFARGAGRDLEGLEGWRRRA